MKLTCNRSEFLSSYTIAAGVAPKRSPHPILQNVKLSADLAAGTTRMVATDHVLSVLLDAGGVTIHEPGECILPVERIGAILRESSDETLTIHAKDQYIEVRGEHSRFKLPIQNPATFPDVPAFDDASGSVDIPAAHLADMIRRTVFCADAESSRYALGAVMLEFCENELIAVATDGRRAAQCSGAISEPSDGTALVPTRSLQFLLRAFKDLGDMDNVGIAVTPNHVHFRTRKCTIHSQLVDGRFPKWRDVFPDWNGDAVSISPDRDTLLSAVRQAAIATNDESRGIDVELGDGTLVLSGQAAEVGSSRVEVPINYDGETITTTLDHRYIADFMKVVDAGPVTLSLVDATSAVLMETGDGYRYVLMPLARE